MSHKNSHPIRHANLVACERRAGRLRPLTAALLLAMGLAAPAAQAATNIPVKTTGDTGSNLTCTLRQAIVSMNTGTVGGSGCLPASIPGTGNTITFDPTTFPNGAANEIVLADIPNNSLVITAPALTIDATANGNVTVRRSRPSTDNTNAFRVMYDNVVSSVLTLNHLTIRNGNARDTHAVGGGGVACNCTALTLIDSVVTGNAVYGTEVNGSGATIPAGFGGGVFVYGADLTLNNSTVSGNSAYGYGGGIAAVRFALRNNVTITGSVVSDNVDTGRHGGGAFLDANLIASDSIFTNNQTSGHGGGMQVNGTLVMTNSDVTGNTAGSNGGGMKIYGVATLTNSTVSGNTASNNGGGICMASGYYGVPAALLTLNGSTVARNKVVGAGAGHGGGIFSRVGNLSLINSTVAANASSLYGGGIYIRENSQPITLTQSTLAANSAVERGGGMMIMTGGTGTITFNNSALVNTMAPFTGGGNIGVTTGSITIAGGGNLAFGGGLINASFANAPSLGDPKLTPLGNFGGLTATMVPMIGSAAINAIPLVSGQCPLPTDQRGVLRPQGTACDIGAVEFDGDVIFADSFGAQ